MKIDHPDNFILDLLRKQLSMFLVTGSEIRAISAVIPAALTRVEFCFRHNSNKYYHKDGAVYFNPFHSGQWCIFLYYLSNTLFKTDVGYTLACDKIYYLNRALNGCDLYYQVALPDIFMLDHPLGTVMGRARYGNFFTFSQGCTVGNNKGVFPEFGEHVSMLSDSKVLGNCVIGDNVIIAANAYVKDESIPSNAIVFGSSPNLTIKPKTN